MAIDPLTAIGVGGSLISGVSGLFGQKKREKRQHQYNRELAQYSYDRQQEAWDKAWKLETEYNDPKAQMERLAAAGINPALAYASGNVGNTVSAPGQLPQYNQAELDVHPSTGEMAAGLMGDIIGTTANLLNMRKDKALARTMEAQASIDEAKADIYRQIGWERDLAKTDNEYRKELITGQVLFEEDWDRGGYRKKLRQELEQVDLDTQIKRAVKNGTLSENDVKEYRAKLARAQIDPDTNPIIREFMKAMASEGVPLHDIIRYFIRKIK